MFGLGRNSWLLVLVQPFAMAISSAIVLSSGFVGKALAPSPQWATLPISLMIVGLTIGAIPAALLMQRFGRKPVFLGAMLLSSLGSMLAAWAISHSQFAVFLLAITGIGSTLAVVQQFRFAAIEGASHPSLAGRAVSILMLGSVLAALIGTETVTLGQTLLPADYAGSYALLSVSTLIAFALLLFFKSDPEIAPAQSSATAVPIPNILKRPTLMIAIAAACVGYSVMAFVMTATPLAMHEVHLHSLASTKWVIQSHIMAMYLPSLITGELIRRFGSLKIIYAGLLAFLLTTVVAFAGADVLHYWWALVLLGLGWNFLFIGGTTLLAQSYLAHEKFKIQAINDFSIFVLQATASLAAGAILFAQGWSAIIIIALVPTVLMMLALGVYLVRRKYHLALD
ncbi:MAG: MFS transporter [Reinekea forsetii]|nr:MFS transporter [Reinekea forsetii]